jgi:hypothetical protein
MEIAQTIKDRFDYRMANGELALGHKEINILLMV